MRSKLQIVEVSPSERFNLASDATLDQNNSLKHDGRVKELQVQHLPIIGIMRRMLNAKRFHNVMQLLMLPTDQNVASARVAVHRVNDSFTVVPFDASIDNQS
jgi:hypothetical protein